MRKDELLRSVIRETIRSLSAADVALSKERSANNLVDPHGMGRRVRVELNGKTWLTASQAEVDRVLKAGGRVVMHNGQPVREGV